MTDQILAGSQILVVEDEYYLADEARSTLADAGAVVVGPVPSLEEAKVALTANTRIDAALLDVNLRGELVFELADALQAQGVPFAFATGYDGEVLPSRFADRVVLGKPVRPDQLVEAFVHLIAQARHRR